MLLSYLFPSHLDSHSKLLDRPTIRSAIRYPSTVSQLDVTVGALALSLIGACWKPDSFVGGPTTLFGIFVAVAIQTIASGCLHRVNEKPLEKKPGPVCNDLPQKFTVDFEAQYKRDEELGEMIKKLHAERQDMSEKKSEKLKLDQEIEQENNDKNQKIEKLEAQIEFDKQLIQKLETLKTCIECEHTLGIKKAEFLTKEQEIQELEKSIQKMQEKDRDVKVEKLKCEYNIQKFGELKRKIEVEDKGSAETEVKSAKAKIIPSESSDLYQQIATVKSRLGEIERELARLSLSSSRPEFNASNQSGIEEDKKEYKAFQTLHCLITRRRYHLSDLDLLENEILNLKERNNQLELKAIENEQEALAKKHKEAEKKLEELKIMHQSRTSSVHIENQIQDKRKKIEEKEKRLSEILPSKKILSLIPCGKGDIEELEKEHKKAFDAMKKAQIELNSLKDLRSAINTEIISRKSTNLQTWKTIMEQKKLKSQEIENLDLTISALQQQMESITDHPEREGDWEKLKENLDSAKNDRDLKLKEAEDLEASISQLKQPKQVTQKSESTKKPWSDLNAQDLQSTIKTAESSLLSTKRQQVEKLIKTSEEQLTKEKEEEEKTAKPIEEAHALEKEIESLKDELSLLNQKLEKEKKALDGAHSEILAAEAVVSQIKLSIEKIKNKKANPDPFNIEKSEEYKSLIEQQKGTNAQLTILQSSERLIKTKNSQSFLNVIRDSLKKHSEQRELIIGKISDSNQLKTMRELVETELKVLEKRILDHEAAVKATEAMDKELQDQSDKADQERKKLTREKEEISTKLNSLKEECKKQEKDIEERASALAKAEGKVMHLDVLSRDLEETIRRVKEEKACIERKMEDPEIRIGDVKKQKGDALDKEQEIKGEIETQLKRREDNMEGLQAAMLFLEKSAEKAFKAVKPVVDIIEGNFKFNRETKKTFIAMHPNKPLPDLDSVCCARDPVVFTESLTYVNRTLNTITNNNKNNVDEKEKFRNKNEEKIERKTRDRDDLVTDIGNLEEKCEDLKQKQNRAEEALIGHIVETQKCQEKEAVKKKLEPKEVFFEYLKEIGEMKLSTCLHSAPLKSRYFSDTETTRKTTEVVASLVTAFFFLVLPHSWLGLSETNRVIVWLLCNVIQNESHARLDKYLKLNAG